MKAFLNLGAKAFVLIAFVFMSLAAVAAESVEFGNVSNGQMTIKGKGFTKRPGDRNVLIIKSYHQIASIAMNANGSFSYTTKKDTLAKGDTIWIEVEKYENDWSNWISDKKEIGGNSGGTDPDTGYNANASIEVKLDDDLLTVTGNQIISARKPSFEAKIFVNDREIGREDVSKSGTFRFTSNGQAKGRDTVKVVVEDYKGEDLDLSLSKKIPYWYNSNASIEFREFKDGQITIVGRDLQTNTGSPKVRISNQKGTLDEVGVGRNGSFSYTSPRDRVKGGDKIKVQVLDYKGNDEDFVRSHEIPLPYNRNARIEIGNLEEGQINLVGRDISYEGRDLTVRISFIRQSREQRLNEIRLNANGSFSYTSPREKVRCGDRIKAVVDNYYDGKDLVEVKDIPRQGQGCYDWVPEERLSSYARGQARDVFERLMRTYGAREAYRTSYANGFWYGLERAIRDESTIQSGRNQGSDEARAAAQVEGQRVSLERAVLVANSDATDRFRVLIDSDEATVDTSLRIPSVEFESFRTDVPFTFNLRNTLDSLQSRFGVNETWSESGLTLRLSDSFSRFEISDVYDLGGANRYRQNNGWLRSDWAFDGWRNNQFGYGLDQDLYRDLSPAQKREFEGMFQRAYDRASDDNRQWNRDIPSAESLGGEAGRTLGEMLAFNEGRTQGYLQAFDIEARATAQAAFGSDYTREFHEVMSLLPKAVEAAKIAGPRVAETYGRREIFLRDFHAGFQSGYANGLQGGAQNSRYQTGFQNGNTEAQAEGRQTGHSVAQEKVPALIPPAVRQRFVDAVDQGRSQADLEPRPPVLSYEGDGRVRQGLDLQATTVTAQAYVNQGLQTTSFENGGVRVGFNAGDISVATAYNGGSPISYQPNRQYLDASFGVRAMSSARLGTLDLGDYGNVSAARREVFENLFGAIFARKAASKFEQIAPTKDSRAIALGQQGGGEFGGGVSEATGRNDGFNKNYRTASQTGFKESFPGLYSDQFHLEARKYQDGPVLEVRQVSLIDGNGDQIFENSEAIGVRLHEVVNLGMVEAKNLSYSLSGEALEQKNAPAPGTMSIPALTKKKDLRLENLGTVARRASDRKTHTVQFSFNGESRALNFRLGWTALLEQYAAAPANDPEIASVREAILSVIKGDWEKYWANRGFFGFGDGNSFLGQMASYVKRLPAEQKARFSAMHDEIVQIPPSSAKAKNRKAFINMAADLK